MELLFDRNHPLMQDAHDTNSALFQAIEHDMLSLFVPVQSGTNRIARSTNSRILSQVLEASSHTVCISDSLICAPLLEGISHDSPHIELRRF